MKYVILALLFVSVSCKDEKLPNNILSPEKMETVLIDVLLAESFSESYLVVDTTIKLPQAYGRELDKVLAIQHISQQQLLESIDYYKTKPETFKVIIDTVNSRIQREKDKVFKDVMDKKSD
jgi:hypothetical protein